MIQPVVKLRIANKNKKKTKSSTAMVAYKPKSEAKAKGTRRRRTGRVERDHPAVYHITPCGRDYFRALTTPFSPGLSPCIPSAMPLPSQKYIVTSRGSFRTNAGGAGGIAMYPFRGFASNLMDASLALEKAPFISATSAAWAGSSADYSFLNSSTAVPGAGLWAGVDVYGGATSPYTSSMFGSGLGRSIKLVAAGLRIRYTGAIVNMGGRVISWRNPQNTSLVQGTQDSLQQFLALNAAATSRTTDAWFELTYRPIMETDLQSTQDPGRSSLYGANSSIENRLGLAFLIEDLASQSFEFEGVAYYEATGPGIPTTPSHADPQTLAMVMSATPTRVNPDASEAGRDAVSHLLKVVREAGYAGIRGLGAEIESVVNSLGPYRTANLARFGLNLVLGRRGAPLQQRGDLLELN